VAIDALRVVVAGLPTHCYGDDPGVEMDPAVERTALAVHILRRLLLSESGPSTAAAAIYLWTDALARTPPARAQRACAPRRAALVAAVEQAIAESAPERAAWLAGLVAEERALALDHELQVELGAVIAHAKTPHGPTLMTRDWGPDSPRTKTN
jgi:hypothetical protein